jgi:molybdenum cofactor cytidylyltransferase
MLEQQKSNVVGILLAAGSSTRLGKPKQLLKIGKENLVERSCRVLIESNVVDRLLVLGDKAQDISQTISKSPVKIIVNPEYQKGMGSSIKLALSYLGKIEKKFNGFLILNVDQPAVNVSHIQKMLFQFEKHSAQKIISSFYADHTGVPVVFPIKYLATCLQIRNDEGCHMILKENPKQIFSIALPDGERDIDTDEDIRSWSEKHPDEPIIF